MPTGWRPKDVAELRPVQLIEDVYAVEKYDTHISFRLLIWSWIQWSIVLISVLYLFLRFGEIGFPMVLLFGVFIWTSVFSITSLMDKAGYALIAEIVRFGVVVLIFFLGKGDWFNVSEIWTGAPYLVLIYSALSFAFSAYFFYREPGMKSLSLRT